jgi:3-keto-5-aminohexanoate cleavage enzyme
MDTRNVNSVNQDVVDKWVQREGLSLYWRPYGFPAIMDPDATLFSSGVDPIPRWSIDPEIALSAAINGAFFGRRDNPSQPIAAEEIIRSAEECIAAGAQIVHVHVRDQRGYNVLDIGLFREVIGELRRRHPSLAYDACLVAVNEEESRTMLEMFRSGLVDAVPVNTAAVILGDNLFVKPPHAMIEKARLAIDAGLKVHIAVYTDGDIDNARRFLIDSGVLPSPLSWLVLPALPGCSPMYSPASMCETLVRAERLIRSIDPSSIIMTCAAGRATSYVATLAILLGLHVRVGMEDTVWKWPHRDDLIESNVEIFKAVRDIARSLGRTLMPADGYRAMLAGNRCIPAVSK